MNEDRYTLLAKCLAGEATSYDQAEAENWIRQNPGAYAKLKESWNLNYLTVSGMQVDQARNLLLNRISGRSKQVRIYHLLSRVAAGFSLLMVLYLSLITLKKPETIWIEKTTSAGQKSIVILPDNSRISLNSNSRLKYPAEMQQGDRQVVLEGEAFFEVAKMERPFIVEAGKVKITVLGTSFNVENRQDSTLRVVVATGKVKVESGTQVAELVPNQMVSLVNGKLQRDSLSISKLVAWKDGWLIFEETPLGEVARTLKNWYGVTLEFEDQRIGNCLLTARFKNETFINVLENICFTSNLKYRQLNNSILLTGPGCQPADPN